MNRQYQTNQILPAGKPDRKGAYFIFQLLLFTLLFAACEQKESGSELTDGEIPVTFSAQISATVQTRTTADGNQWANGDQVGIFMLNDKGTLTLPDDIVSNGDNARYSFSAADGAMSAYNNAAALYYPQSGKVNFIIYYPYKADLTDYTYPVDVRYQDALDSLSSVDLLYATYKNNPSMAGRSKSREPINATFGHMLSKLTLNVRTGPEFTTADLAGMKVSISGMPVTASFSLADGGLTNDEVPEDSNFSLREVNDSCFEAILIPQNGGLYEDRKVSFTLGERAYEWKIDKITSFVRGLHYFYSVTIKVSGISVKDSIVAWDNTSAPTDGDAKPVTYKLGDYYPDPEVKYQAGQVVSGIPAIGIVYQLDSSTQLTLSSLTAESAHGKIVSLRNIYNIIWSDTAVVTNSVFRTDSGSINLDSIKRQPNWESHYLAFKKCTDQGNRWYLPAIGELQHLHTISQNGVANALIGAKLTAAGGEGFTPPSGTTYNNYWWASTEHNADSAKYINFSDSDLPDPLPSDSKGSSKNIRPIRTF
jgi:hypothetical protein